MVCLQHRIYRFQVNPYAETAVDRPGIKHIKGIFSSPEFARYIPDIICSSEFAIIDVMESHCKISHLIISPGIGYISIIDIGEIIHIIHYQVIGHPFMQQRRVMVRQVQVIVP
jgi:hypothetical protein